MPPAELGQLLTKLAPKRGERALVIGEGGAYSAAILEAMGVEVDRDGAGQYDLILIEGAVEQVPADLARRLVPGGRIGAALVENGVTRLAIGRGDGKTLGFTTFAEAQVPLLHGFTRAPAFIF
jgi:protein-L-isoaspartate(D-aspartate) O-methyltransferase